MLPASDSTQFLTKSKKKEREGEKERTLLKSNQFFSGLNWWTNSLKCLRAAPSSKEEKVRISASLVGAGRGNGATAKPRNRTTSLSEVRGGSILYQVFQNRADLVSAFCVCSDYGSPFLPEKEKLMKTNGESKFWDTVVSQNSDGR